MKDAAIAGVHIIRIYGLRHFRALLFISREMNTYW